MVLAFNVFVQIYFTNMHPLLAKVMPGMHAVLSMRPDPVPKYNRTVTLRTVRGFGFTIFKKDSVRLGDIYYSIIAPYYNADVYAQTWVKGASDPASSPSCHLFSCNYAANS